MMMGTNNNDDYYINNNDNSSFSLFHTILTRQHGGYGSTTSSRSRQYVIQMSNRIFGPGGGRDARRVGRVDNNHNQKVLLMGHRNRRRRDPEEPQPQLGGGQHYMGNDINRIRRLQEDQRRRRQRNFDHIDRRHLEIISPHRRTIMCMDIDPTYNRFLLVGSMDATVSVYDISPWGSERRSSVVDNENYNDQSYNPDNDDDLDEQYYQLQTTYRPIAQSTKQSVRSEHNHNSLAAVPSGHSSTVTYTQWYPTDPGIFLTASAASASSVSSSSSPESLSSSSSGQVLVWDTSVMKPVLSLDPFRSDLLQYNNQRLMTMSSSMSNYSNNNNYYNRYNNHNNNNNNNSSDTESRYFSTGTISADLRGTMIHTSANNNRTNSISSTPLLAVGAWNIPVIKLMDLRSSSSGSSAAHTLTGHHSGGSSSGSSGTGNTRDGGGITSLRWSPTNSYVLVSGGYDSTVRLWDIRKSGSRAMITVLNHEHVVVPYGMGSMDNSMDDISSSSFSSSFVRSNNFESDYSHLRPTTRRRRSNNNIKRRKETVIRKRQAQKKRRLQQQQQPRNDSTKSKSNNNNTVEEEDYDDDDLYPYSTTDNPSNYDATASAITSHSSGHVAALEFTNDGRYIVSVGAADGEVSVWDLVQGGRLSSKFVVGGSGFGSSGGSSDSRVTKSAVLPRQTGRVPLLIEERNNYSRDSMIWIARKQQLLGFSLLHGGRPIQTLDGSLSSPSALTMNGVDKTLFAGSTDGGILAYGHDLSIQRRRRRQPSRCPGGGGIVQNNEDDDDDDDEDEDNW